MTMADGSSRYGQPNKSCDIVLKGGITSGVVYPLALVSLAEKYRFSGKVGTGFRNEKRGNSKTQASEVSICLQAAMRPCTDSTDLMSWTGVVRS